MRTRVCLCIHISSCTSNTILSTVVLFRNHNEKKPQVQRFPFISADEKLSARSFVKPLQCQTQQQITRSAYDRREVIFGHSQILIKFCWLRKLFCLPPEREKTARATTETLPHQILYKVHRIVSNSVYFSIITFKRRIYILRRHRHRHSSRHTNEANLREFIKFMRW